MARRNLKRKRVEVEVESGPVTSKYFRKKEEEAPAAILQPQVDFSKVKSMDSASYFHWINSCTNDEMTTDFSIKPQPNFPENFIPIYSRVKLMRSKIVTPVDTVGCAMLPITVNEKFGILKDDIRPQDYRLQLLMALMLSSQTKDETNAKAMHNVMKYCIEEMNYPRGIVLESLLKIDEEVLDSLIHPVGFHSRKAKYVKLTVQKLLEEFNSDVPTDIQGLISLPGVGPKMGFLTLQKAWGVVGGIGVDVHVDRLCKMWKWVDQNKCKTPDHTRKELEKWLPHELWYEINPLLVGFGQVICMPRGKRCDLCLANDVCNSVDKKILKKGINLRKEISNSRGDYSELIKHLAQNDTKAKQSGHEKSEDKDGPGEIKVKKETEEHATDMKSSIKNV